MIVKQLNEDYGIYSVFHNPHFVCLMEQFYKLKPMPFHLFNISASILFATYLGLSPNAILPQVKPSTSSVRSFTSCLASVKNGVGDSPQGGVISPLLANIYLDYFDKRMMANNIRIVRYEDDILILQGLRPKPVGIECLPQEYLRKNSS